MFLLKTITIVFNKYLNYCKEYKVSLFEIKMYKLNQNNF